MKASMEIFCPAFDPSHSSRGANIPATPANGLGLLSVPLIAPPPPPVSLPNAGRSPSKDLPPVPRCGAESLTKAPRIKDVPRLLAPSSNGEGFVPPAPVSSVGPPLLLLLKPSKLSSPHPAELWLSSSSASATVCSHVVPSPCCCCCRLDPRCSSTLTSLASPSWEASLALLLKPPPLSVPLPRAGSSPSEDRFATSVMDLLSLSSSNCFTDRCSASTKALARAAWPPPRW
mmetsp:Transcript_2970/g.9875  ORF Transcript_2970/g.9875 Transcript_2970/m.9875 type:complete len:231 (-) Transcript_2970:453-1145(-)